MYKIVYAIHNEHGPSVPLNILNLEKQSRKEIIRHTAAIAYVN